MDTGYDLLTDDYKAGVKLKNAVLIAAGLSLCVCAMLGSIIYLVARLS